MQQNGLNIYENSFADNFGKENVEQVKKLFAKNFLTKTAANIRFAAIWAWRNKPQLLFAIVLQFGQDVINLAYE